MWRGRQTDTTQMCEQKAGGINCDTWVIIRRQNNGTLIKQPHHVVTVHRVRVLSNQDVCVCLLDQIL